MSIISKIDDEYLYKVAIHEAGHAVCAIAQGIAVWDITIEPEGEVEGRVLLNPFLSRIYRRYGSLYQVRKWLRIDLAGYVAECLFNSKNANQDGSTNDFKCVEKTIQRRFSQADVTSLISELYQETASILIANSNSIFRLVSELLAQKTLNEQQVKQIVSESSSSL